LGIVFAAQSNSEFVDNSLRTLRIQSEAPFKVEAPRVRSIKRNSGARQSFGSLRDFEVYIHKFMVSVRRKVNKTENFP
jgi:hypothetical protein